MKTAEIRRRFLDFFAARDHEVVPSAPLLYNDPTLLFVNAGMVPFKRYFIGAETPPFDRAASVQNVRTLDIDEVGKTTRHATFFQMNGNFSFGDYFKAEAIRYAWELVTGSQAGGGYGFDPDRIWVTVLSSDDEAAALWENIADLPPERIQRRGVLDNYWHMGVPGPGGPCARSTSTAVLNTAQTAGPSSTRIASWRSGIWSSCRKSCLRYGRRTTSTSPATYRKNIDTGWAWSASRTCCRVWTTSTRSIRSTSY